MPLVSAAVEQHFTGILLDLTINPAISAGRDNLS